MNSEYTHVSMLLDRSGSMAIIANDTIGGFNTFLKEQKALPGKMTLTLAKFDTTYEIMNNATDIQAVEDLTDRTFVPRGGTALFDSAKRLIEDTGAALKAMKEKDRPATVMVVIITDGEENASHNTSRQQLAELIKHQEDKYNWHFIYLGANQDAFAVGHSIGNYKGSNINYSATRDSVISTYTSFSSNVRSNRASSAVGASYVAMTQADVDNTEKEIKKKKEDKTTKTTK